MKLIVAFLILVAAGTAGAQNQQPAPQAPPVAVGPTQATQAAAANASQQDLTGYYAVSEIPATILLGTTPASIARPSTAKDFGSAILNGIDATGRVKQGLALESSLGLFKMFNAPLDKYQSDWRVRFFSNLSLSLASVRVADDTADTDAAWGVRAQIYDGGDPLAQPKWTERLGNAMLKCAPGSPPGGIPMNTGQTQAQVDSEAKALEMKANEIGCLEKAAEQVGKLAADSLWNAPRLVVAYAGSVRFRQSEIDERARLADRYWTVGSVPLSLITGLSALNAAQLIGYLDYSHYRANGTVKKYSAIKYGGRLNYGSAKANIFYELLGESRSDPPPDTKKNDNSWSLGVEFLAAEGVWISTGFGKRAEDLLKADKAVLIANIRWGVSSKSLLNQ